MGVKTPIEEDIEDYIELCERFGERVQFKTDGTTDHDSPHAARLWERWFARFNRVPAGQEVAL